MHDDPEWYPSPAQAEREAQQWAYEEELRHELCNNTETRLCAVETEIFNRWGPDAEEMRAFYAWRDAQALDVEILVWADYLASEQRGPEPIVMGLWALGVVPS